MKNLVRFISTILLIALISSIAVPALASGWEERYGTKTLRANDGSNNPKYVKNLQSDLREALGTPLVIDGKFGESTRKAVITFQRREGLTADGIVGNKTSSLGRGKLKLVALLHICRRAICQIPSRSGMSQSD